MPSNQNYTITNEIDVSTEILAKKMIKLYEWVINSGPITDFIKIN